MRLRDVALRTSLIYLIAAAVWIAVSDRILVAVVSDPVMIGKVSTYKGWMFVGITAVLLYGALRAQLHQWESEAGRRRDAERRMFESSERLKAIVEGTPDAIYVKDIEGRYVLFNTAAAKITGHAASDVIGNDDTVLFDSNEVMLLKEEDRLISIAKASRTGERTVTVGGKQRTFLWTKGPLFDESGNVTELFGIARDITEQKQNVDNLRASERKIRSMFRVAPTGVGLIVDRVLKEVNDRLCNMTGYAKEELLDQSVRLVYETEEEYIRVGSEQYEQIAKYGTGTVETRWQRKDGQIIDVLLRAAPIDPDSRSREVTLTFTALDITEQKRSEKRQEMVNSVLSAINSRSDIHALMQQILLILKEYLGVEAVGVRLKDGDDFPYMATLGFPQEFVDVERQLCGCDEEGFLILNADTKPYLECMCGNIISGRTDASKPFFTKGGSFWTNSTTALFASTTEKDCQTRTRNHCNSVGYESVALIPLRSQDRIVGLLQFNDTRPDRFTLESIQFLEQLAASIGIAVSRQESQTYVQNINDKFLSLYNNMNEGVALHELVFNDAGKAVNYRIVDANNRFEQILGIAKSQLVGMPATEAYGVAKAPHIETYTSVALSGKPCSFEAYFTPLHKHFSISACPWGKEGFASIITDITDRKRTEEALVKSEQKFRNIFESALEGIFQTSMEGKMTSVNPALAQMHGFSSPEEMLRETHQSMSELFVNKERRREANRLLLEKGVLKGFEVEVCRKEGSTFWASITAHQIRDDKGTVLGFEGMIEDITERKRLEEQLRQAQKMEAIGTLAGGIAHDFNNILTVIIGFTYVMHSEINKKSPMRAYVDQILASAEKAANLTQSLLAFSRKQQINLEPHNINNIIRNTAKLLKRLLTEDIELKLNLTQEDVITMADVTQVDQILMNLATNARDAMPRGGSLMISTGIIEMKNELPGNDGYEITPGKYVRLSISDTGTGMDEATKERIFDPFFTTKEVGKGTGLGLSSVYGIVRQHDGQIGVESEPGKGTTFHICLPLMPAKEQMAALPEEESKRGSGTILVAEDDQGVRNLIVHILESSGYTTIEAIDGDNAITVFERNKDRVDLIILDVVMPIKNGKEALERIKEIRDGIPALFMSGYTGDIIIDKGIESDKMDFIAKPISVNRLLEKVREMLDRQALSSEN